MKILLFILLTLILQQTNAQKPLAKITGLAFMSGTWQQKHVRGDMEEFWGPPMGNNMICSYRCVKDGKAVFYEFELDEINKEGKWEKEVFNYEAK